jgi:hypothetical protein
MLVMFTEKRGMRGLLGVKKFAVIGFVVCFSKPTFMNYFSH